MFLRTLDDYPYGKTVLKRVCSSESSGSPVSACNRRVGYGKVALQWAASGFVCLIEYGDPVAASCLLESRWLLVWYVDVLQFYSLRGNRSTIGTVTTATLRV